MTRRHVLVAGVAAAGVARVLWVFAADSSWLHIDVVDVGMTVDGYEYRKVVVRSYGFQGLGSVSIATGDPCLTVVGHRIVRELACPGTATFVVGVPSGARSATIAVSGRSGARNVFAEADVRSNDGLPR